MNAMRDIDLGSPGYDHNDRRLKTGEGGITVWTLQNMAQEKRFEELDELFNNGVTMNALPVGYCAGAAARVFDADNKLISELLDYITGKNWRGKVFFTSKNIKFPKAGTESESRCCFQILASSQWPNSIRCCWTAIL